MKAIFAGTFDPFTLGHRDIVERVARIFGSVIVAIAEDTGKAAAPLDVRKRIAQASLSDINSVIVDTFSGLLTDYIDKQRCDCVIVRGIRNSRDAEYERELSRVYKSLNGVDELCLFSSAQAEHISSTVVRALAALGAPLNGYVHANAVEAVSKNYFKR